MGPLGHSTHLMPFSLLGQTDRQSSLRITLSGRPPVQHVPVLRTQGLEHHTQAGTKRAAERFSLFKAMF